MITHLTKETFEAEVKKSNVPVLVDFWATWCGPCQMQGKILEELDKTIPSDKAKICKVDVDENQELASSVCVESIPTLLFFKDGEIQHKAVGVRDAASIKKLLGVN